MGVIVTSNTTETVAANTKTANEVTGQFENVGAGRITLAALASATGMRCTLSIGGITLINDQPIPFFGATGTMSLSDNVVVSQALKSGGRVELYFRNTTGAGLTVDYQLLFEP
jgi:hypothetical protein